MKNNHLSEVFPVKIAVFAFLIILFIFSFLSYFQIRSYRLISDFNDVDVPVIQLTSTQIRLISELNVMIEAVGVNKLRQEDYLTYVDNLKSSMDEIENLISTDESSRVQINNIRSLIEKLKDSERANISTIQELRALVQNYIEDYLLRKHAQVESEKRLSSMVSLFSIVGICIFLFSILVVYRKYQSNLNNINILSSQLEEQRIKSINSSKLASIGEMAAGLAHEINNPLAVIVARTDLTLMSLESNEVDVDKIKKSFEKIKQMTSRISNIIESVRKLARGKTDTDFSTINLEELIRDILNLVQEKAKLLDIEIRVDLKGNLELQSNYTMLSQVIINLVNNAIDELKKDEYLKSKKQISIDCYEEGACLILKVADSGKGIPTEVREKMFTPFFTTKEVGKGTGIGLSISLGLMKELKGELYLDPSPQTTFVLKLQKA